MVWTIPTSAWTWLVRPRKASAVTMNGAGFDAGEGNPGLVIILQKWLGVDTAVVASSVGRGWSCSVWCSVPESPNGRSDDMGPPSSAKMLGENLLARMSGDSEPGSGSRLLEWWRAYIVGVVDHPYLATRLPLWLTLSSYTSTTPVVLAMRDASTGEGIGLTCVRSTVQLLGYRPYLCQVGRTTTGAPIPTSDQLIVLGRSRRWTSCPKER
ncbi:hypothetical protein B296_00048036 [Ensete ventricosum]|uniref:Uncharacterized protein n=1 Tax=Ensete ventricosum TaxID=4639 RepID=A0A426WXD2_ENSVE|nr:hypothetical protein B296_00048036 [Ensete ventricosum]